jgi:hypothetical protein
MTKNVEMTKAVRPYSLRRTNRQAVDVSMYRHILESVLDDWVDELSGPALVDFAVVCRNEMLRSGPRSGDAAHVALAAEVAYDRALIKLCFERQIVVDLSAFSYPVRARFHLEHALADIGVDLTEASQVRLGS